MVRKGRDRGSLVTSSESAGGKVRRGMTIAKQAREHNDDGHTQSTYAHRCLYVR